MDTNQPAPDGRGYPCEGGQSPPASATSGGDRRDHVQYGYRRQWACARLTIGLVRPFVASVLVSAVKGFTLGISYWREEVAMCRGDRLMADFVAGTDARPALPEGLEEHLTTTVNGLWVVWAHKLAQPAGDLFLPLTGGPGYPADARAECRARRGRPAHDAPDPGCTCGFHALSSRWLPGLPPGFTALTVALSGRVLALEWAGEGVLWRAERQTVVRMERPTVFGWTEPVPGKRRHPDDPDGRPAAVSTPAPRDSGPIRLNLPLSPAVLAMCHDDAGWCVASSTFEHSPASLALT